MVNMSFRAAKVEMPHQKITSHLANHAISKKDLGLQNNGIFGAKTEERK